MHICQIVLWRVNISIKNNIVEKRIGITIFLLLLFSYSYFLQDPFNWNPVTRVALGISMVEDGSLNINKFRPITQDMAFYDGKYYSDKAPGMTFSALPAIAITKLYLDSTITNYKWVTNKNKPTPHFVFVMQIATIAAAGFPAALAALALFFVAIRLGAGLGGATFGALAYGLATPVWGWSTTLFGHSSAGACLFLGFAFILYLLDLPSAKRRDIALGFLSGALLSWAVVIEYTSAPASAIIAMYALVSARQWERERFIRVLLSALAGAVIFILPLLIYNYLVYENLFTTGYRYHATFTATKEGFYGIESPKIKIIGRLLVGMKRGIFWLSPLLLFTPIALYRLWKTPAQKGLAITIIAITLYYFLWNSGYVYWSGGSTTGPRFLTPILPFLCLSLAFLWSKASRYLKAGLLLFFALSFFLSLASVSVSMVLGIKTKINFVIDHIIPNFIEANNLTTSFIVRSISPSSNGNSHIDLLPLYIVLAVGGIYILWELETFRRKNKDSG